MTDTIVVADCFDLFGVTADLPHGYWTLLSCVLGTNTGRFGNKGLTFTNVSSYAQRALPATVIGGPIIVGAAFDIVAIPSSTTTRLIRLYNSSGVQLTLALDNAGHLIVYRGDLTTLLATSTATLTAGYHTIQLRATIDPAAGAYGVWVDGSTSGWPSGSGANTRGQSDTQITAVRYGYDCSYCLHMSDPLVITGSGFLGDWKNILLQPGSDLATGWTRDSGSANYARVQAPQDDLGSYVSAGGNVTDSYGITPPGTLPATVYAVGLVIGHVKDVAGTCTLHGTLISNGSSSNGPDLFPATTFALDTALFMTDPATGAAWTPTALNALQLGLSRTA